MKRFNLLVLSLTALALVSCGGTNNSQVSSANGSSSANGNSSVNSVTESLWDADLSAMMKTLLGEDIPYIQFQNEYTFSLESDSDGDYIYISSDNEPDRCADYTTILANANYTDEGTEVDSDLGYTCYFYSKQGANGNIIIQYDAFPGYTPYAPCFEIYAWVEEDSGSGTNTPTGDVIADWSTEDKAIFNQYLGEVIPVAPLYEGYTCEYDSNEDMIYIIDVAASSSAAIDYCTTLEAAGYVTDDYYNYKKDSTIEGYYINLCIFDGADFGMGFWIMASLMKNPATSNTWPEDLVKGYVSSETTVVPAYQAESYDFYDYSESSGKVMIMSIDNYETPIEDTYKFTLEEAGWTIDDSNYNYSGYLAYSPNKDVKLTFSSYLGRFTLEIENVAPALEAASTVTITATSAGMPTEYSTTGAACTIEGYSFIFTNSACIGGTSYFQIKKNTGVIECTSEIENLAYVQINYSSTNQDYCTVEGKKADGTWEAITGNDYYQYDLTGYVSFKIIATSNASYFDSIVIGLNA